MSYSLGRRSKNNLRGVHKDLVKVVERAIEITEQDFTVTEGLRSETRQRMLFNKGASKTMNSRHLTGHAVDLIPYPFHGDVDKDGVPNIEDWDAYKPVVDAMRQAAKELNIPLTHGYDWGWDGPHHELPRKDYP